MQPCDSGGTTVLSEGEGGESLTLRASLVITCGQAPEEREPVLLA